MITIDQSGRNLVVDVSPDAQVQAPIHVAGRDNQLIVQSGASIAAYAPAGFAATVPDPSAMGAATITIDGEDNRVEIASNTRLGVNLTVRGRGNRVLIGPHCHLHGFMNLLGSDATLVIGPRTTMVQGSLQLHEAGEIRIGADCMLSSQVYVSLSDIHPIFDRGSGRRLNAAASIELGDHVWVGLRCMVMKGAKVGGGSVLAAGAIVSGAVPENVIAAGAPARVIRDSIEWRRDLSVAEIEPQVVVSHTPRRRWWWPSRKTDRQ